jgi:hypothetical protein
MLTELAYTMARLLCPSARWEMRGEWGGGQRGRKMEGGGGAGGRERRAMGPPARNCVIFIIKCTEVEDRALVRLGSKEAYKC